MSKTRDLADLLSSGDLEFAGGLNVDSGTLFVDEANNRVGVGTSSPDEALEVYQGNIKLGTDINTTSKLIFERDGSVRSEILVDNTNQLQINANNATKFFINGSEAARIDSSGNVGIGTSSPEAKLDVNGGALLDGISMQTFSEGDTGISVNQSSSGGIALFLATSNFNSGTAVDSGLYLLKFFVDGDNTPAFIHIAGDDFASISQSSNNTLVINGVSGNDRYAIIGFSPFGQMLS